MTARSALRSSGVVAVDETLSPPPRSGVDDVATAVFVDLVSGGAGRDRAGDRDQRRRDGSSETWEATVPSSQRTS